MNKTETLEVLRAIAYWEMQKQLFPNSMNVLSGNIDIAIHALEKQVPQLVIREPGVWPDGQKYVKSICPSCHDENGLSSDEKRCSECGQNLDWSETK